MIFTVPVQYETYHSSDHDDFRSDVLLDVEELEKADVVERQRQGIHHACPDECFLWKREAQYDGYEEEQVNKLIELVPSIAKVS